MKINERPFLWAESKQYSYACLPGKRAWDTVRKITLVMKLICFLMISALMQVSASTTAQITINTQNAELRSVLKSISRKSGYDFIFADRIFTRAKPVNVQLNNANIREALDACLEGQSFIYEIKENTIFIKPAPAVFSLPAPAEVLQLSVSGQVVDVDNTGIPAVTVSQKNGTARTVTDQHGNFRLSVSGSQATLVFTSIGFVKTELPVTAVNGKKVLMRVSSEALSEIVVVGYGTQKKANLTGAVGTVDEELLRNRPVQRLSQALQGTVPNLNILNNGTGGGPNATQGINIRGFTGFGNLGTPLLVVDGVPGGDLNTINPGDVESISVLKDQASSSIYGVDGAFGVILVTTKKGAKDGKMQANYNNNISFAQLINVPKEVSSLEYVTAFNDAAINSGSSVIYPEDQIARIKEYLAGTLTTETQANAAGTDWNNGQLGNANNKWFDIMLKDFAKIQQHNFSLNGGAKNISYYVGAGYQDRDGMLRYGNDNFKLYNLRANLSTDLKPWVQFNLRSSFSRSRYETAHNEVNRTGNSLTGIFHQLARTAPVVPLYNPDGNLSNFSDPVWQSQGGRAVNNQDQVQLTGEVVLRPLKGLNITANYTLFAFNNENSDAGKTIFIPRPDGSLASFGTNPNTFSRVFARTNNSLTNMFATYERSFGEHNFKLLGGYIRRFNQYLQLNASNSNLYSQDVPSLSLTYNDKPIVSDEVTELGTEGFFSRFNYDYKGKWLLEFDGRYDATSRFISNRWQFYPGVSAGYVISKEPFWAGISRAVHSLKLRASYGRSGDQSSLSAYPFYPSLNTVIPASTNWLFGTGRQAAVSAPGVVNPFITWQKPTMIDFGFDATFFKDKLSLTFDWYKRTMKDLAVPSAPLPAIFGTSAPSINAGEVETKGFELSLTWRDRIGGFRYDITAGLSDYRGVVTRYPNPTRILTDWFEGRRIGDIYGYTTTGLYASDVAAEAALPSSFSAKKWLGGDAIYVDLDNSGRIDNGSNTADKPGDLSVIGNNTPRYSYNLSTNMQWKNFDLNIFLQGVAKRDVWVGTNYFWGINGDRWQSSYFSIHRDHWTPENTSAYFPKFYMNAVDAAKSQQVQSRYLQNAAYLRVKNVQLGYTLSPETLSRLKIAQLRFFVGAENLLTFTKMVKTLDPELAAIDGGQGNGKVYPLQRTFTFGLNFTL